MFRCLKFACTCLMVAVFVASPLAGQTTRRAPQTNNETQPPARNANNATTVERTLTPEQGRALGVLDDLFEAAKSLDNERMRIRMLAQIADLLWDFDEARSRRLFQTAFLMRLQT